MDVVMSMWVLSILALISMSICDASKSQIRHHHHNHQNNHCYTAEEGVPGELITRLASKKMNWDNLLSVKLVQPIEKTEGKRRRKREQKQGCPISQYATSTSDSINERSISPWEYEIDFDESRYPQKLAKARCLCNGCIHTHGSSISETRSLVSTPVEQSMLVLRKKPCGHNGFRLETEYIKIPVACTCAKPRYGPQK